MDPVRPNPNPTLLPHAASAHLGATSWFDTNRSTHLARPNLSTIHPISDAHIMTVLVDDHPITIAPSSLVRGKAYTWTEPVDEAAQCLVSMSSALASSSTATTDVQSSAPSPPRAPRSKPDRLALACNTCRKRKVRCDAHQPKCHNCLRRGDVCITSDPRKPGAPVPVRRKTTRRHTGPPTVNVERLLARQAEQQGQRDATSRARRLHHQTEDATCQDALRESLDDEESQDGRDDDYEDDEFAAPDYLEPELQDHAFSRPRLLSHSVSYSVSEAAQPPEHIQPTLPRLAAGESQPSASARSPASVGSSVSLAAASSHNRSRNNASSNGGDTELPSWVTRAYHEISAQQARRPDHGPSDAITSEQQQDPTVTTPDVIVNSDGSTHRLKVVGGSSLQCLIKFTDVLLSGYGFDATAPLFRHGMAQSDELDMPLLPSLPNLPPKAVVSLCIDAFFDRIWPLFPAVDRDAVQADADAFLALQQDPLTASTRARSLQSTVHSNRVPNLVMLYSIVSIGMNETSPSHPLLATCDVSATEYLTASYALHAHLTASPYQPSVQALLLLALSLRGCGKEGQSWYILGLAIRLAMSIGLHKSVEAPQQQRIRLGDSASLPRRLWWSCFSLERLLQLECGRPSSIDSTQDYGSVDADLGIRMPGFGPWRPSDEHNAFEAGFVDDDLGDCDDSRLAHISNDAAPHHNAGSEHDRLALFPAWVSLAAIMGQISDRFYNHRFGHAIELLSETARLVRCLTRWETALPDNLKPQSISLSAPAGNAQVLAAFLAQQFYHAKIAVLRIAILFPQHSFQNEVRLRAREMAGISQLLGSASHCLNAARSLTTLTLQLADAGVHSILVSVPQTFLASIVLALSILRAPRSRLARADVELLTEATTYVEGCYETWGYPSPFLSILSRLREGTIAVSRGQVRPIASLTSSHTNSTTSRTSPVVDRQKASSHASVPTLSEDIASRQDGAPAQFDAHAIGRDHVLFSMQSANAYGLASVGESGNGNGSSTLAAFTGETGIEAFSSMEFEDFWDMLKADIFM